MEVRKQFIHIEDGVCRLLSEEDKFVPEMSLPIKMILEQFSFIDNVRLADIARQGYAGANDDENDFDVTDFDSLDPAEREEVYNNAAAIVKAYEEQMQYQKETTHTILNMNKLLSNFHNLNLK